MSRMPNDQKLIDGLQEVLDDLEMMEGGEFPADMSAKENQALVDLDPTAKECVLLTMAIRRLKELT